MGQVELWKEWYEYSGASILFVHKDEMIDIRINHWSHDRMHVSIYNDRNDTCVGYTCNKEELKGLADFLYTITGK
jgi:uncharacterized phage-associated protein